jgi:Zn-dependent protease
MSELSLIQRIIIWIIPLIFAITVHETAHGWMAKKFGDNTAAALGRLTINPLPHIDWLGTIIIPGFLLITGTGFIFGWAKPVPVDARNFKNPRQAMAYVSLAGPGANLIMALSWALLARIGVLVHTEFITIPLIYWGMAGISINLVFALINLIPIPPLDGSRVLSSLLPPYWAWRYNRLEPYGFFILLFLLYTKVLNILLEYPLVFGQKLLFNLAGL